MIETQVWEGETCQHCGKDVHGETYVMDDNYFCSEHCFGAYLIEQHEEDYEVVDMITEGEIMEREREDWADSMRDRGEW